MNELTPKVTAKFLFEKLRTDGVLLLDEVRNAGGHNAREWSTFVRNVPSALSEQ